VFSLIPTHLPLPLRSPPVIIAIAVATAAATSVAGYVLTRRKPSAEEIERERRDLLARTGRITDGTIMDTMTADSMVPDTMLTEVPDPVASAESDQSGDSIPIPRIIVYNYRIAWVTYECAQDVTMLAEHVHGIRSDLPVQVRYEPHNPVNSIVVAESWSGLRLSSSRPHPHDHDSAGGG
jgi:hypothetical protein